MNTRYWIGVVSESHVKLGVAGGYAQVCHGKSAPLNKMQKGDYFIYYSPKTDMNTGESLQMFTAIGQVVGEEVYQYEMFPDFVPFRRDIQYFPCNYADIKPLLHKFSFIKDVKKWGFIFRQGHFEITKEDFTIISEAMNVKY